jgi:hypothetical protein
MYVIEIKRSYLFVAAKRQKTRGEKMKEGLAM